MNTRQAAALALVGWYLMIPPLFQPQTSFNHWLVIKSFKSADDCLRHRKDFKANPPKPPLSMHYQYEINDWYQRVDLALCVSTDNRFPKNAKPATLDLKTGRST